MATTVKMHEAKTHLSSLVARALAGEDIVIARGDKPQVKLVPVMPASRQPRVPGALKGQISIPDSFFDPMSDEELKLWEGE
jgi:antitoxin (DNA-binding transcriptional repressor) of toxin-antitoxin stability system